MTSVEKRRSSRKSRGRRKHSNGALSDASSTGSFPDETDREVSNLTDRAFRSLCIGDEAVYNDSDLNSSSPCFQSERQRAFSQGGPGGEREAIKRAARENFSLRMQQYGQNWMQGGMYEAQVHRDPQCGLDGESAQLSATFQHSFVNPSQQEAPPRSTQLSSFSNGATELSLQQRRSRSRVSSLIQAFNTEGYMDGAGTEGVWDRSALIGIQTGLAQLSYQQTLNSGHFPSTGLFPFKDPTLYASETAAVAHANAEPSFTRSSHSKHSVSRQVDCNSNVFIHSEFSPFRVWKGHNRFPVQRGDVSGFLNCSEFSQWYETPMYRKLSTESQAPGRYHFQERDTGYLRNNFPPMVPPTAFHPAAPQKSVEKRCESELAGYYPHWKGSESLGANRLPPQRPSTASPATEMSRRVQDTISSVKAFQQKIKLMSEQSIAAGMQTNKHEGFISNNSLIYGNDMRTEAHASTTPFSISQLLTPFIPGHQEAATPEVAQHPASPQPVEHAPVRAESRGANPDVRTSSYKSKATSLLFNLKDNRKRVKSTYSPNKFKASETLEKNRQQAVHEPRDTVIDIPDDQEPDVQSLAEQSSGANIAPRRYVMQCHTAGFSGTPFSSAKDLRGQCLQNTSEYQTRQTQGELLHHPGFTGFMVENCTSSQLPNGQNLFEDVSSFTPCKQAMRNNVETQGGDRYRLRPSHISTETPRANSHNNQMGEYLISKANPEQHFNETVGRESTKVKHNYSNASSQNRWRQANNQDAENISLKTAISPWKQEITSLMEKDKRAQESQREAVMKEKLNIQRDRGSGETQQSRNHETEKNELGQNGGGNAANPIPPYRQQQYEVFEDKQAHQNTPHENERKDLTKNYQDRGDQQNFDLSKYECMFVHGDRRRGNEMQPLQAIVGRPQFKQETPKKPLSNPNNASAPATANQPEHSQAGQATAEDRKAQHAQAELAGAQNKAQEVQRGAGTDRIFLAEQASSDKVKAGQTKTELKKHKRLIEDITEQARDKKMKENLSESSREQQTKVEQTTKEEPKHVTGETAAKHKAVNPELPVAERLKKEHLKTEDERAEQVQTEHSSRATLKAEQVSEKQEREQGEVELIRLENVQAGRRAAESRIIERTTGAREHEKTKADEGQFIPEGQVKQPTTQKGYWEKTEAKKAESPRLEQKKLELAKALLVNAEDMLQMCTKPAVKLKIPHQVKSEPDKVEQVKTELARAKAELAKIKEKMREEQKEKSRNTAPAKDDGKDLLKKNLDKKEERKPQEGATQNHQQSQEATVVSRVDQANSGPDDYERLRQKYGFTNTAPLNKNKMSAAENAFPTDNSEIRSLSPNEFETRKDTDSKDKHSPKNRFASVKTENKRQMDSLKPSEGTETPYVYSESSKEFKLSNDYDLLVDKVKNSRVQILEKCNSPKHASKQGGSDLAKVLPLDRKNKSSEHSLAPTNDPHLTPSRSLSHKERAQTKQEILTSRIKAYAEKEISAIKESLAKPDGFLSIPFSKSAGVSQNPDSQSSPSQEMPYKHDSNAVRIQLMETSGAQKKPVRSASSTISASVPVQAAAPVSEFIVPEEAKTSNNVSETPIRAKQTDIIHTKEGFDGKQTEKNNLNIDSPVKCEEHKQENKERTHRDISGEEKKALGQNSPLPANQLEKNVNLLETSILSDAKTPKYEPREKVDEDSTPSLKIVLGQNETPATDDSLQIMGITVTVKERTPQPESNKQGKKPRSAETDHYCPSVGVEVNESLKSANTLDGHSRTRADQTRVGMKYHTETVKDTSGAVSENVQDDCSNLQLKNSATPQRETQFQEPLTEEGPPCSRLAENKVMDINKPHLYKKDTTQRETKGRDKLKHDEKNSPQTALANENCNAETQLQSDSKSPLKEERVINPPESLHIWGQMSPLLVKQSHDLTTVSFREGGPNQLTGAENIHKRPEGQMEGNKQEKVHIDSITVRVLPTEPKQDPDSRHAEKGQSLKTEKETKDGVPTSCEEESKDSQDSGIVSSRVKSITNTIIGQKRVGESRIQQMEGGYFQMERVTETNVKPQISRNPEDTCERALPGLQKAAVSTEGKHEAFALEHAKMKTLESSSENMETKMKASYTEPLKQGGGPTETQSVRNTRADVAKSAPIAAQHRPDSTAKERKESSQNQFTISENAKEKQEVKPKTKERASTIPEISAIADYARLKVILSEDHENTIQEFPPHKKEGFFPLIQSRHSRRPVFTAEPQTPAVKERTLPSKPEIRAKVNKESKPLVFPITEKEHQRTGMFKLGDKEKQEKNKVMTKEKHIDKTRNLDECASKTEPQPKSNQHLHPQPNEKQMDSNDKLDGNPLAGNEEKRRETRRQEEKEANTKEKRANQPEEAQAPPRNVEDKTEEMKIKQMIVESRTSLEEEQRRVAQREEERRAREREATAILIKQRREEQREAERRAEEERQGKQLEEERRRIRQQDAVKLVEEAKRRAKVQAEEEQKIKQEEWSRLEKQEESRAAQTAHQDTLLEKQLRFIEEEQQRRAEEEEQLRRAEEEKQERRAKEQEQLRRAEEQEQQRRAEEEEQQRRAEEEEQLRRAAQEQLRRAEEEEQQRRAEEEEQQRRAAQEQQRRAEEEEQQRRVAQEQLRRAEEEGQQRRAEEEEQLRRAAQEQLRRAEEEEQQRRAEEEEQQRRVVQEQQRRAEEEEQQRRVAQEQLRRAEEEEQLRRAEEQEQQRRAKEQEQLRRAEEQEQQRRAEEQEQQRRVAQEQLRRAEEQEQQRRAAQEQLRRTEEQEQKRRAAQEQLRRTEEQEQQRRAAQEQQRRAEEQEQQRRAEEQQKLRRAKEEEQQRRTEEQEQQRRAAQEQLRRAEEQEQQRRAAYLEEHQKRATQDEQLRKSWLEEHQRRAAQEEQQRRAAHLEELQRQTAHKERRRRAAYEEQQRRAATQKLEEQQRQAVQKAHQNRGEIDKEKQKRAVEEDQQKRAEVVAQQRRVAQEEQQWRAAELEEQQKRATKDAQQFRTVELEGQQKRPAHVEQKRAAAFEDLQLRSAKEEQQKRDANEEHQRRKAELEEKQRTNDGKDQQKIVEKQHCRKADGEQQRKAVKEEQQRRAAEMERRSAQGERRITGLTEQQRQAEPNISVGEQNKTTGREEGRDVQTSEKKTNTQIQNLEHQIEGKTDGRQNREAWMQAQEEEELRIVHKEKTIIKEREATEAKVDRGKSLGERHSAVKAEKAEEQEQMSGHKNPEITVKETDEEKEMFAAYIEKERAARMEQQKRASQLIDALQYYTIASAESERKARERRSCSPVLPQRRNHLSALESTEDQHVKTYRPQAPSSPAPSLPRSNTSSPALGNKPSMFRVKDNTLRASSFVRSVKPRFHKSFGDDFRVVSPMGSEKVEEEQDALRSSAATPLHLDSGSNRLTATKDSFPSAYSSQGSSGALQHYRPYSRRSVALDEDDSRSVFSIMSEDVESFATSAADLADVRTLYEYDRPESSCSFSSDMSRSMGKPPVVPPKSEKALRRAKRLTTRRIKKELSKVVVENPLECSAISSSPSAEVQSSGRTAVATPHSSPPVSLAYAPKQGSSLPSSHTEQQSSFPATAHAAGPNSLPAASCHVAPSASRPAASPHAIGPVTHATAPKTIANVPSSPTLHHTSHQAPVAKYQFESSCPNSYPLTQRKVLQDIGSGQYFVVDMPVQVRTKTFFDPETGRYVRLNVRESARRPSQPQHQQTCPPPQPQPQSVKLHRQDPPAVKPGVFHQGYHRYPQGYQPADISTVPHSRSSVPGTLYQDQQPVRDNPRCTPAAGEMGQDPEEHYYSSEKAPYMDTVNDLDRNYNTLESFPECDPDSQIAGSLVYKNDNSANSQYESRDIIAMSELEDFMELSDW